MSYVERVISVKEALRGRVRGFLSREEVEKAERDPHAKRPPRPCGITVHPGVGCVYECKYCYVYDMGFKPSTGPYPLTGLQLVYALLSNKYFVPGNRGTYIAIGSVTEPFHPLVKEKTLEYIEAIYKYLGNPVQFSTKLYLDPQLSRKLAELSGKRISPLVTITTMELHRELEPRAPSPEKRLESIRNLREAGLQPFLFLRPIIPGVTEREYKEILERAVEHGAVGVVAGSLRVTKRILENLREIGIDAEGILKRLSTPLDKMKPGVQYTVEVSDVKKAIAQYALKLGLVYYPSACMANLHTHGLKCWKMCTLVPTGNCTLEEPAISEVKEIAEKLGAQVTRVSLQRGELVVTLRCKGCNGTFISEVIKSRYLVCVRLRVKR